MKPWIKIAAITVVLVAGGAAAYFAWQFFASEPDKAPTIDNASLPATETGNQSGGAPPPAASASATASLLARSDHPVFDYWVTRATGEVRYLTPDGRIFTVREGPDLEAPVAPLPEAPNTAAPSPGARKFLVSFGNPRAPQWAIFDIKDGAWKPLPRNIATAAWGANDAALFAITATSHGGSLVRIDLSRGANDATVLAREFPLLDVRLYFIPPATLFLYERPSSRSGARVWSYDETAGTLALAREGREGFSIAWLPGNLAAVAIDAARTFTVLDPRTLAAALPVPFTTLPEKCTTSESELFCFVPRDLPATVTIPDDYFSRAWYAKDSLFTVALDDGSLSEYAVASPDGTPIDARSPRIVGGHFYLIDRYSNKLYELEIGK